MLEGLLLGYGGIMYIGGDSMQEIRTSQPKKVDTLKLMKDYESQPNKVDMLEYRKYAPKYTQVMNAQKKSVKHIGGYDYHKKAKVLVTMNMAQGNHNEQKARYVRYNGVIILTRRLTHKLQKEHIEYIALENSIIIKLDNGAKVLKVVYTTKSHAEKVL